MIVGDGKSTRFWLKNRFPSLYRICWENEATVEEIVTGRRSLSFRRNLGTLEREELVALQQEIEGVSLTEERDMGIWKLEESGRYSIRSLYQFMLNPGTVDLRLTDIWNTRIPLKIQIFLWMVWHDRIQIAEQLKKRKWSGQVHCKLCAEKEDLNHLLFRCPVAIFVWCWVRDSLGWLRIPSSFEDFQASFLGKPGAKNNCTHIFLFAGVCWALWRTRNDWVFSDILVRHPKHIAHRTFGFLQQWRALSTKSEEEGGGSVDQATCEAPGALKTAAVA